MIKHSIVIHNKIRTLVIITKVLKKFENYTFKICFVKKQENVKNPMQAFQKNILNNP